MLMPARRFLTLAILIAERVYAFLSSSNARSLRPSTYTFNFSQRLTTSEASNRQSRHIIKAMFSGIIEEKGKVIALENNPATKLWDGSTAEGVELTVNADVVLDGVSLGCSISVNGVCLTVTDFDIDTSGLKWFKVGLAPETLRLSNLCDLRKNDEVNLERALASGQRNSGHFVQGHVDNVGKIIKMEPEGDSLWLRIQAPTGLMRYIVPKGFIAIDGTSLTVCEVNQEESWFSFMLVAYTQQHVIISNKKVGDKVNIEVDVLSKYVTKSLATVLERLDTLESKFMLKKEEKKSGIPADIEFRLGDMDNKIKNRDLVINQLEEQISALEEKLKKLKS